MSDTYQVPQANAITIDILLRDSTGTPILTYTGGEPLLTTIWTGDSSAALFTATTTWVMPAAGTIAVAITAAQTASVAPGLYQGITQLNDAGTWVAAFKFLLEIQPFAGGIAIDVGEPPSVVNLDEAERNVPVFETLSADEQLGMLADVTSMLNDWTYRILPLSPHDEVGQIQYPRLIQLKQFPVTNITRVATCYSMGLVVGNSTLTRPTVELVPSNTQNDDSSVPLNLTLRGFSAGVPASPVILAFSTYKTLGALATAINALGNGWTASLGSPDFSDLNTVDLNRDWGQKGSGTTTSSTVGAPLMIYAADIAQYEANYRTGAITVHQNLNSLWSGGLSFSGGWGASWRPNLYRTIRVTYSAGFNNDATVGPVTMPSSLKRAAYIMIRKMIIQTKIGDLKTDGAALGGYRAMGDLRSEVETLIGPFINYTVV